MLCSFKEVEEGSSGSLGGGVRELVTSPPSGSATV